MSTKVVKKKLTDLPVYVPNDASSGSLHYREGSTDYQLQLTSILTKDNLAKEDGYKYIGEVSSFSELRNLRPTADGVRVKLRGYFNNSAMGGGDFIGFLGNSLSDDGGCVASGTGYYWVRDEHEKIIPQYYGATPENTDNANYFQAMLAGATVLGLPIYIPATFTVSALTYTGDDLVIFGPGKVVFSSTSGMVFNGCNRCKISELSLIFAGVGSTGVTVNNCSAITVEKCTISNHGRNGGVYILGSTNVSVIKNMFLNAAGDATFGKSTTADVNIWGTNSFCEVIGNKFLSGGGYGVQIRSHSLGDVSTNHVISDNIINGYNSYGINCYRNKQSLTDTQILNYITVTNNIISNISGDRPSNPATPTVLIFGTGIYMQGAEYSIVTGNILTNVCTASNNDLLAPAGIGITNIGNITVTDNVIVNSGMYGIKSNDSVGLGDVYGRTIIADNTIDTVGTDGIMVQDRNNIKVSGNSIKNISRDGIKINASPSATTKLTTTDKNISDNTIRNVVGTGVYVEYTQKYSVYGNKITTCSQGIVFQYSAYGSVNNNVVDAATTRGYYAHVTNTVDGSIVFTENRALNSSVDISVEHPIDYFNNPGMTPAGTYAEGREITADLPNVTGCGFLNLKPTSAINFTGFLGGKIGQRITIWVNNGNATFVTSGSFILAGLKNRNPGTNGTLTFIKTKSGWVETGQSAYAITYSTPTTGSTVTIADFTGGVYIQGSTKLDTLSVILPSNPVDDQQCIICGQSGVTTLTLSASSGKSIYPTTLPTTLSAGAAIIYRYRASATAWFRYQ